MQTFKTFFYSFLLLMTAWNAAPVLAKPGTIQFINCRWDIDGRKWKTLGYNMNGPEGLVQFIPEENQGKNWKEFVSMQWYENRNTSQKMQFEIFIEDLQGMWPDQNVSANIISESNLALIGEWWTDGSTTKSPYYGLVKIFNLNGDIYLLTYTACDSETATVAKSKWLPIFRLAILNYGELERKKVLQ